MEKKARSKKDKNLLDCTPPLTDSLDDLDSARVLVTLNKDCMQPSLKIPVTEPWQLGDH